MTAPAKSPCENSAKSNDCGRRRRPEPQSIDAVGAVADHGPIVGDSQQIGGMIPRDAEPGALQLEFGVQGDDVDLAGPHNLPGIGVAQPVVGLLDLPAVADRLPEDAVFVAQAVADGRVLQRGEGVDEAGGQPAEAAVAQPGVRLLLDQLLEVPAFLLHGPPHERLRGQVHHVVPQRPPQQKLHRQVVDALGIGFLPGTVASWPSDGRPDRG